MIIFFPVALLLSLLKLSSWEEGWGGWEWHFRKTSHLGNRAPTTVSLQGSPRCLQWLPSILTCGRLSPRSLMSRLLMFISWAALSSCSWHSWSMLLSTTYSLGEAPGSKRNRVNGSARQIMSAIVTRRRGWESRFVPFFHCGRRIQTFHCSFSPGWAVEQPFSSLWERNSSPSVWWLLGMYSPWLFCHNLEASLDQDHPLAWGRCMPQ